MLTSTVGNSSFGLFTMQQLQVLLLNTDDLKQLKKISLHQTIGFGLRDRTVDDWKDYWGNCCKRNENTDAIFVCATSFDPPDVFQTVTFPSLLN